MREIPLTRGKSSIVDDADYDDLVKHNWRFAAAGYAMRDDGKKVVYMHKVIVQPSGGMDIDHINGNRLDNRRENLRICTRQQNLMNRGKQINNTSGFKGVWKNHDNWRFSLRKNGKQIFGGTFKNKEDAARAYDDAVRRYYGEFAEKNLG